MPTLRVLFCRERSSFKDGSSAYERLSLILFSVFQGTKVDGRMIPIAHAFLLEAQISSFHSLGTWEPEGQKGENTIFF